MNRVWAATFAVLVANGGANAFPVLEYHPSEQAPRSWLPGDWNGSRTHPTGFRRIVAARMRR